MRRVWGVLTEAYGTNLQKHCQKELLDQIFPRLPNLKHIVMNSCTSPFTDNSDLIAPWQASRDMLPSRGGWLGHMLRRSPHLSFLRYKSILLAAQWTNLTTLSIHEVVLEALSKFMPKEMVVIANGLSQVKNIALSLVCSGCRTTLNSEVRIFRSIRRLAQLLGFLNKIEQMHMGWNSPSLTFHSRVRGFWQEQFFQHTWPLLKKLSLIGNPTVGSNRDISTYLAPFLGRHKATLREFLVESGGTFTWNARIHATLVINEAKAAIFSIKQNS